MSSTERHAPPVAPERKHTTAALAVLALITVAAGCSKDGAPQYVGGPSVVESTYGQCAFCHNGLATHMVDTGGHASLNLKCDFCHPDQQPGQVGPGHRAVPACADCHDEQMTHHDPAVGSARECTVCHTPHGSANLLLVRESIEIAPDDRRLLTFTNRMGLADGSYASASQPGTGVCEVCHDDTSVYRRDGNGAPHFTSTCTNCHEHLRGFAPPATVTPTLTITPTVPATPTSTPTGPTLTPTATPTGPTATPTATDTPVTLLAARVASAPSGLDDPVWNQGVVLRPVLTNVSTGLLYGDGQLNMTRTFDGVADFNGGEPANLELRAVHDGTSLYIRAQWSDRRLDPDRQRWLFDGPTDPRKPGESATGWTSQRNDDQLALAFEIASASSEFGNFATAGCAAACHDVDASGFDMRPAAGTVDLWSWKVARSEPLGYAGDQVSDAANGRRDDAGTPTENRNLAAGGNDRSGPAFEWDGTTQTFTRWDGATITLDPAYFILGPNSVAFAGNAGTGDSIYQPQCGICHGSDGEGGIGPALNTAEAARLSRADLDAASMATSHPGRASYNQLSAADKANVLARIRGFAGVPGYFLTAPSGSVADIRTQSNVQVERIETTASAEYRVLLNRPLSTGGGDDVQFTPGGSYVFGVALMDGDGRNHVGSPRETLALAP